VLEAATQVCDLWYQAPTARESERALRGVRFGGATDTADTAGAADAAADTAGAASPLVLDLGCGFGVGLLSIVQPSPPAAVGGLPPPAAGGLAAPAAGALLPPPVNVLGCDASALKVGDARLALALALGLP
jgi:hypothetical protein